VKIVVRHQSMREANSKSGAKNDGRAPGARRGG
jgi:hypothetical protein